MRFKRRLHPEARVDLIPMIDVVFQLVIFFMVTSTFMLTPGINIIFPTSTSAEPVVMTSMVVTILSQDEIYFNKERHALDGLNDALAEMSEEEKEEIGSVVVEGDRDVSYDLMIQVLDRLRLNGFKSVGLRLREEPGE